MSTRRTARPCMHVNAPHVGSRSAASVRTEFGQKSSVAVVTRCRQSVKGANMPMRCGNLINEATMKTADRLYSKILIFFTSPHTLHHCPKLHHELSVMITTVSVALRKRNLFKNRCRGWLMKLMRLTNAAAQGPMGCFHLPKNHYPLLHEWRSFHVGKH